VGTIHSFVNEFLAIPWLRSQGLPIKLIDTEVTLNRRWKAVPYKTRAYLEHQGLGKYALSYDRPDFGGGKKGSLREHTDTYKALVAISKASSNEGYYCYDEMFVCGGECAGSL